MAIRVKSVDNSLEEKILTGLIVSDRICRDTLKLIKRDTFQNPYVQTLVKWVSNYYKTYHKAPQKTIQDIYNVERTNLKNEESLLIGTFLGKLSDAFEREERINEDYLIDRAVEYVKKRALKNISERIESCVETNKVDEAEKALQSYQQITKDSQKFINPFSDETVKKFFVDESNNINKMFAMPGALGSLIGYFERGTLVGIMAPAKRGKSFLLMEIALQAFFERFKVLFVSLEMNSFKMERRLIRRITAFGDESKEYIYPCFDCFRNQIDECNKSIRTNNIRLRDEDDAKPDFDSNMDYRPCTACRGKKDYLPETWFELHKRPKRKATNSRKVISGISKMYQDNFRLICYPKFSANVQNIKSDILSLEQNENFIPDVIVIDYADILAPEDSRITGRDRYDETWKMFGNLADVRRALVVTASQTNRQSFDKKNVTQTDASEDIRKIANVEMMLVLNQTTEEKRSHIMRVAVVAGRDDEFDQYKGCVILQNLALGQVCLDSEMLSIPKPPRKEKEKSDS